MQPTLAGFIQFIRNVMGISTADLPDSALSITYAYYVAVDIVDVDIAIASSRIYTIMVYNLAADNLINYAQDQPGLTYFANLRTSLKITNFVPGIVQSASDAGTSDSLMVPDFFKTLTLQNLQNLKTTYGRTYLQYAQSYGTLWGMT